MGAPPPVSAAGMPGLIPESHAVVSLPIQLRVYLHSCAARALCSSLLFALAGVRA